MKSISLSYLPTDGWSQPFPAVDSPNTLVVVFAAPEYAADPRPLEELANAFPQSVIIGCSTAGEVSGACVEDGSISVGIMAFDTTELRRSVAHIDDPADSRQAGFDLASDLARHDLVGVFVLSEGLGVNGSELARGLNSVFGTSVIVTGGLAADADRFEKTWTLVDGKPQTGMVVAVGFYGDSVSIGYGFKGGWDIFGPQRRVTRSTGNVVFELDGEPALELYERYLGELAAELPGSGLLFPLSVWENDPANQVVRTLLGIDRSTGSVTFAGDVPEGAWAQLMQANFDRLVEGAEGAALMASSTTESSELMAIAVSCVGRRLVLGDRVDEEVESALGVLPPRASQIGFYSYGELSPDGIGTCDLHNQTMTITVITER